MKIIRDRERSFDLDDFLKKPLFAHLSTMSEEGPRDSPVWFHWEGGYLWVIGQPEDSFPKRIQNHPTCAIGVVDFDRKSGKVLHAGFRGEAAVVSFDEKIASRLLCRYLGDYEMDWDPRFKNLDDGTVLICFDPETVVVRDVSYNPVEGLE